MDLLIAWLTVAMLAWSPAFGGASPAAHDSEVQRYPDSVGIKERSYGSEVQRYAEIARSALDVAFDPAEKPLFEGPHGRAKTALQMLAIAGFESSYRRDVQMGIKRGKAGDSCLMQVIIPAAAGSLKKRLQLSTVFGGTYKWVPADSEEPGLTADDLVGADVHTCFRVGLHIARESFQICHDLSMYTNGQCNHEIKAKHREMRAHQHYKMHPAPVLDADILPSNDTTKIAWGF